MSQAAEVQQIWCGGLKENGTPCGARASRGSDFCYWHDPATEEERMSGLVRRERYVGVPILAEEVALETVADVIALQQRVVLYLAAGNRIEPARARALNGAVAQLLKGFQIRELQAELTAARAEIARLDERCREYEEMLEEALSLTETAPASPERRETGEIDNNGLKVV